MLFKLAEKAKKLTEHDASIKIWLDNEDVCRMLNISKRTLQFYRDPEKLAFSQTNHKIYYKPGDVEDFIQKRLFTKT